MTIRADRLAREFEAAFRNRADRLLLNELTAEIGAARAETILSRVVEPRGREVAAQAFVRPGLRAQL